MNNAITVLFIGVFSDEMVQLGPDQGRDSPASLAQWKVAWHVPKRFYCTTHIQQNKTANAKGTRDSVVLKTPILEVQGHSSPSM